MKVGELVWWDGGCGVGRIHAFARTDEEMFRHGVDEPSVFIAINGRVDQDVIFVAYPLRCLEEDGVGVLSGEEEALIGKMEEIIQMHMSGKKSSMSSELTFGYRQRWDDIEKCHHWEVVCYNKRDILGSYQVDFDNNRVELIGPSPDNVLWESH